MATEVARDLEGSGYELHAAAVSPEVVSELIAEVRMLASEAKAASIRDVERHSGGVARLAESEQVLALLPGGLRPVRTILFDKTPKENWPVGWHQDLSIAVAERREIAGYEAWTVKNGVPHVRPPVPVLEAMITVRLHLDNTPATNGALRVVPGSHRYGRIPSDEVMDHVGTGTVTCECEVGDVLLMKPLLLHASSRSRVAGHRRVVHIEYARRELLDDWLQWHMPEASQGLDASTW